MSTKFNPRSAAFLGIVLLLMYLRHPGQFIHPQFWVEGSYIYSYAFKGPILDYLFAPIYGYLMIPERLIVLIFTPFLPIEYHPLVCDYVSILLILLMLWYFISTPSRLTHRSIFALTVFISPLDGAEVFNKLLYLMWLLPLSLLFILFRDCTGISKKVFVIDIFWIVVAGLSGPLVIVFVPAYIFIAALKRHKYFYTVCGFVLLLALVQCYYLVGDPKSAVSQSFTLLHLMDILNSLLSFVVPQFFIPEVAIHWSLGLVLLIAIFSSSYLIKKEGLIELFLMLTIFFSFILSSLIKLYPYSHYISGSRYLYFPYLALTFYFLLIILQRNGSAALILAPMLAFVFYSHMKLFQLESLDYKWSEHIQYAKDHLCKLRVPVPYQGLEGVAWAFDYGNNEDSVCQNKDTSQWLGGKSEKIQVLNSGDVLARSALKRAVFSMNSINVEEGETFVNFSLKFKATYPYEHKIGIKYFDSNNKVIKTVYDRLDISSWPIFVSYIPKEAKYFRPFVRLNAREVVEISDVSILVL